MFSSGHKNNENQEAWEEENQEKSIEKIELLAIFFLNQIF